jgi:hypothetical protein
MIRPTTLGALVLAVLALAVPPAGAKEPMQVEVHNHHTGITTKVNHPEFAVALGELIGRPPVAGEPRAMQKGRLEPVATLTWGFDENSTARVDKVYADKAGRTWVQRHDHLSDPVSVSWARVEASFALDTVLSAIENAPQVTQSLHPASTAKETRKQVRQTSAREAPERFDASSFGWGAGLGGLLVAGLVLAARWRGQRSVTASRNSRVSSAASS